MRIVSGCPRSGTSMMMDMLRRCVGDDKILGKGFEEQEEPANPARAYLMAQRDDSRAKAKDMNPGGFWECQYTVQGCHYRLGDKEHLAELENESLEDSMVCKIVSQGLTTTHPRYVHKVLYMLRDPYSVAKSQERLTRPGLPDEMLEEIKINTPVMFNRVSVTAARWFLENPEIPLMIVDYDKMIEHPEEVLPAIGEFFALDPAKAIEAIDPNLRRSKVEDRPEEGEWADAVKIWRMMGEKDFQGVVDYMAAVRPTHVADMLIPCARLGSPVGYKECKDFCRKNDAGWILKQIALAERHGVNWRDEPCLFECGLDPLADEKDWLTTEASVDSNHWEVVNGDA